MANNNSKNKRIVFVIEALTVGGAEHMLVAMANRMQVLGWDCSVICLSIAGDLADNLNDGVNFQVLGKKPGVDFSVPGRLRKCIQSIDPVAVNCHLWTANTWTRFSLIKSGYRVVATEHSRDTWKGPHYRFIDRLLSRAMFRMVAVSGDTADFYKKEIGIAEKLVTVINNGINTEKFRTADGSKVRAELATESEVLVGTVGRMISAKNHPRLVEAIALLRNEYPDLRLVFVGDGPEREPLEAAIDEAGIADITTLTGTRHDVPQIFKALDIFVLSSDREGHPLTALEAQAAGTPVVLTNAGGSSDAIVRLDETSADAGDSAVQAAGLLVEKSTASLADGIRMLLDDEVRLQAMARLGIEQAEKQFDEDVMVDKYIALFDAH